MQANGRMSVLRDNETIDRDAREGIEGLDVGDPSRDVLGLCRSIGDETTHSYSTSK